MVERTVAWLNHSRRLSKYYEGQESSSEVMIWLAKPALASLPLHMSETTDMMFKKRRRVADVIAGSD